ncbi:MAG: glycoside hydrolase family 2 [Atopobiaceae bacterium]|nr:glycoside hydrolase family 2 [Atopobiaceae bacterium]
MDLDLKRVLAAKPGEPEDVELTPLTTEWGDALDVAHILDEYPRPQLVRDEWTNLNGLWDYAIVESSKASDLWMQAQPPIIWDGSICVPFSPEAALSGVKKSVLPSQLLWYRRTLDGVSHEEGKRTLLHFEAVDYACACYVNGVQVGTHVGGCLPFSFDITDALNSKSNMVELCVWDPSEQGTQLRGKQRLRRGNMWYTAQSGIWQTVWMETVPNSYVCALNILPRLDDEMLELVIETSQAGETLVVEVTDADGATVATQRLVANEACVSVMLQLDHPHAWDVDDPYLYGLRVAYGTDEVKSYCAFRTVGVELDEEGVLRFCLNHKPLLVRGLLDQGYWPDGLMTAPSDEALLFDIDFAHTHGFNMLRKHIKVESRRWYWHCDRMGMLVWQDMVSGGGIPAEWTSANTPTLFRCSWSMRGDKTVRQWNKFGAGDAAYREEWQRTAKETVRLLGNHPCVCAWVVFNESWGQFNSAEMCAMLKEEDSSRPYVATSGWYDQGAGDFLAVHNYFRSMRVYPDKRGRRAGSARAFLLDEFGGLTCPIEGHTSVPTVYGYDTYEDVPTWRAALEDLLAQVDALWDDGLAGFVYTQLSDVEEETNGLVTYDRRVDKLA